MPAHLGQHFLTSQAAIAKIVAAANLKPDDTVLEIGPGKGVLTEALLATGARVIAVEKDPLLAEFLRSVKCAPFIKSGQLTLVECDIRDFDLSKSGLTTNYSLVANIPYYLTGEILRQFLGRQTHPSRIVLLVQKEVALRIVASNSKESILSLSVKAYGTPHIIGTVKAGSFSPPPKVDSAILLIDGISRERFRAPDEETSLFDLLHRGFAHKRKLLRRNLSVSVDMLAACGIAPDARAETLSLNQWICLAGSGVVFTNLRPKAPPVSKLR